MVASSQVNKQRSVIRSAPRSVSPSVPRRPVIIMPPITWLQTKSVVKPRVVGRHSCARLFTIPEELTKKTFLVTMDERPFKVVAPPPPPSPKVTKPTVAPRVSGPVFVVKNENEKLSVADALDRFLEFNDEMWGLDFTEGQLQQMYATAPEWPEQGLRWLQVRRGTGDQGVQDTIETHLRCAERVLGSDQFVRSPEFKTSKEHLRLLGGNAKHRPGLEWVTADLGAVRRPGQTIIHIRREKPRLLLSDALFSLLWMIPEIALEKHTLFAGGYEWNINNKLYTPWTRVPLLRFRSGRVTVDTGWEENRDERCVVPAHLEPKRLAA